MSVYPLFPPIFRHRKWYLAQSYRPAPLKLEFIRAFEGLVTDPHAPHAAIGQDMLGGAGLWLRAEPGEDAGQADALAAIIAVGLAA